MSVTAQHAAAFHVSSSQFWWRVTSYAVRESSLQIIICGAHHSFLALSKLRYQGKLPLFFPFYSLPIGLRTVRFSSSPGFIIPLPPKALRTK